jgi:hypothetical protein
MKATSLRFLFGCGTAFLLFSVSAQAVTYQAENYSAFYDTTAGNSGGAYRADNVDIEPPRIAAAASTLDGSPPANGWRSTVSMSLQLAATPFGCESRAPAVQLPRWT